MVLDVLYVFHENFIFNVVQVWLLDNLFIFGWTVTLRPFRVKCILHIVYQAACLPVRSDSVLYILDFAVYVTYKLWFRCFSGSVLVPLVRPTPFIPPWDSLLVRPRWPWHGLYSVLSVKYNFKYWWVCVGQEVVHAWSYCWPVRFSNPLKPLVYCTKCSAVETSQDSVAISMYNKCFNTNHVLDWSDVSWY